MSDRPWSKREDRDLKQLMKACGKIAFAAKELGRETKETRERYHLLRANSVTIQQVSAALIRRNNWARACELAQDLASDDELVEDVLHTHWFDFKVVQGPGGPHKYYWMK